MSSNLGNPAVAAQDGPMVGYGPGSGPIRSAVGGGGTSHISKPKSPYSAHEMRDMTASLMRVISLSAYTDSFRVSEFCRQVPAWPPRT
jgi:hypothetical protein